MPISKTADIQYSGHEVFWIEDLFKLETTVHFNCDTSSAELYFARFIFTSQFHDDGAFADWCDELAQQILGHSFSRIDESIAQVNEQLSRKLAPE